MELAVSGERMTIDFAGTGPAQAGNLNAPRAVVQAAVIYVLRALVAERIPLNGGCLTPLTIKVPAGSLLNPAYPAAVVAGNVETSQCVTDVLFMAVGALANSQGTMNNLTFGNVSHQYYETIAGGSGAGPGFPGASGVQCHMTNSRLTDPEVLEFRYPVLLESFVLRKGSGGKGRFAGGDGVVRKIRFNARMSAGILSNNRARGPQGIRGGGAGKPGRNRVVRADGTVEELGFAAQVEMEPGDLIEVETPGGGGCGPIV